MNSDTFLQLGEAASLSGVAPEQMMRDAVEEVDFFSHFRADNKKLAKRQSSLWFPAHLRMLRFMLYFDYQQVLLIPPGRKVYITQQVGERDKVWMFNLVKEHVDEVVALWMDLAPKLDFSLKTEDFENEQTRLDAEMALCEHFNREHLTPLYVQELAKQGAGFGAYYSEVWFDKDSQKGLEVVPRFQSVGMPGYQLTDCLVCGELSEGLTPTCSHCGSLAVRPMDVPEIGGQILTGHESVRGGEIEDVLRPAYSLRYSLVTGFAGSSYLVHEEEWLKEKVAFLHGHSAATKAKGRLDANEEWVRPEQVLRRAERGDVGRYDTEDDCDSAIVRRFFREPELLHFKKLRQPVTVDGVGEIPAGVRLSEVFPEGMCIAEIEGDDRFLSVTAGSFKKRFTQGVFSVTPGRKDPQGMKELPEMNKLSNLVKSGLLNYLLKYMNAPVAVIDEVFGKEKLFNRNDAVVRVNGAKLAAFQNGLQGAALPITPAPLSNAIFPAMELVDAAAQSAGKAQRSDSADPRLESGTATAVNVGESRFTRNAGLYLAGYAQWLIENYKQKRELAKEHYGELRQISRSSEDSEKVKPYLLRKADLEGEVSVSVKKESLIPNLKVEKQVAAGAAIDKAVALAGAGIAITPGVEKALNRNFGTDIKFNQQSDRIEECEEQLRAARENLEVAASPDPMMTAMELYMRAPVDFNRLGHDEKEYWWREWKSSSQGRKAPIELQMMADLYIAAYSTAAMQEQQFAAMKAAQGMALVQNMLAPPQEQNNGKANQQSAKAGSKDGDGSSRQAQSAEIANAHSGIQPATGGIGGAGQFPGMGQLG